MTVEEVMNMSPEAIDGLGYASVDEQSTLLGEVAKAIASASPMQKAAIANKMFGRKLSAVGGANLTPRDEAIQRMDGLPKDVQKAIFAKRAQFSEQTYYSVRPIAAVKSVRMFVTDQAKETAVTNLSNAKIEKDHWFLLTAIRLLQGNTADAKGRDASYGQVSSLVANGNYEFLCNDNKYVLPKDAGTSSFRDVSVNLPVGTLKLSTPKWIEPEKDITFDLAWDAVIPADEFLRAELIGVEVLKW